MPIRTEEENGRLTVFLSGDIDHATARPMMLELDREVAKRTPCALRVDMSAVTFMDSSGIAVVLRAKRRMEALQGSLLVVNIPRQAARVLETAGMARYVDLV